MVFDVIFYVSHATISYFDTILGDYFNQLSFFIRMFLNYANKLSTYICFHRYAIEAICKNQI